MLGLIHKCVLRRAPKVLASLFPMVERTTHKHSTRFAPSRHSYQLFDYCEGVKSAILERSVYGLVKVYNRLPPDIVSRTTVKEFQRELHNAVKVACKSEVDGWKDSI